MRMTKWGAVVIIGAIVAGAALLQFSLVNSADNNWVPVHWPYPGAGLTVTDTFYLQSGGRFALQIVTPGPAKGVPAAAEDLPIRGQLGLDITGPNGFRVSRTISDIHRGGWSGQVDMFAAGDPIELPSRGEYEILLSSLSRDALFTERGAVVRFVRMEPVGPDLLYSVAQWAAYVCFIVAAVGVFFSIGTQTVVKNSFVEQK